MIMESKIMRGKENKAKYCNKCENIIKDMSHATTKTILITVTQVSRSTNQDY
jgi:hypothetical protein